MSFDNFKKEVDFFELYEFFQMVEGNSIKSCFYIDNVFQGGFVYSGVFLQCW